MTTVLYYSSYEYESCNPFQGAPRLGLVRPGLLSLDAQKKEARKQGMARILSIVRCRLKDEGGGARNRGPRRGAEAPKLLCSSAIQYCTLLHSTVHTVRVQYCTVRAT